MARWRWPSQRVAIERYGAITKFVCTACGRGFLVDDGFATVHRLALGLLLLALGAGVAVGVPPEPSRQNLVGGAIVLGFGAAGLTSLWVGARRALRRSRHRLVRLEIADADP